jgi:hypothetical protein
MDSLKEIFERRLAKGPLSFIQFTDGTVVSFCALSLQEFKTINLLKETFNLSSNEVFDILYEYCVPEKDKPLSLDLMPAGISETIGLSIWNQSDPMKDLPARLEEKRQRYNSDIIDNLITVVITAFPAYKVEDLTSLPIDSLLELVVSAEKSLALKNPEYKQIEFRYPGEKKTAIDFDAENKLMR